MEREIPRNQPESDVPELEVIRSQEDKEVIAEREIPLHEEMGFDSAAQMEQARTMQAALLKEKDMAKADQLRAELKALLDDSDGEPSSSVDNSALKDRVMATAAASEARVSGSLKNRELRLLPGHIKPERDRDLEDEISKLEFQEGMANAARRLEVDEVSTFLAALAEAPTEAKADQLRGEMRDYFIRVDKQSGLVSKKLAKFTAGFDEQSRAKFDELAEARKAKDLLEIQESVYELTTPNPDTDETAAEKLGQVRGMNKRRTYAEAKTEVYQPDKERREA